MNTFEKEDHNAIFQGIVSDETQTENVIKHRINSSDKVANTKAEFTVQKKFRQISAEKNISQSDSISNHNTEKSSTHFNFILCSFWKISCYAENFLKCKFTLKKKHYQMCLKISFVFLYRLNY